MKHVRLSSMLLILLMLVAIGCTPEPGERAKSKTGDEDQDVGPLHDASQSHDASDTPLVCGNGVLDPGELCDPGITSGPGTCPLSCDDGNVCTEGRLEGVASECTAHCVFDPVTTCQGGDGCCPDGCTPDDDGDCLAGCGDGVLVPGESCDPGIESGEGACPTSCGHADPCLQGTLQGHPSTCSARCVYEEITQCVDGDGCCPMGCTVGSDDDCSAGCVPLTCIQAGVRCGPTNNGCGEPMSCPSCPDGETCQAGQCVGPDPDACTSVALGRVAGNQDYSEVIQTRPLENIELSGDVENGIAGRYEWSIITRPSNSLQQLTPDDSAQNPRLWLDLAGTYEIELVVYDEDDVACAPSLVTIHAVPGSEIHIQLTWTIPTVPDPGAGNGTDLDLHYLHPTGRWDQAPGDVHWKNRQQNWGTEANPSTASLDIDDLWGMAPENTNHSNPVEGLNYSVGVYYFNDKGKGASDARVRVYINGELREERPRRLTNQDFWLVGYISWPNGDVTVLDTIRQGFP